MKGGKPNFHKGKLLLHCLVLLQSILELSCAQLSDTAGSEVQALLKFKAANGNNATALSSWENGTNPCTSWNGLKCPNHGLSVKWVNLPQAGLSGNLSEALGTLRFLTKLLLQENAVAGPVPVQMSALVDLKHLRLDGNRLGGVIPSWIGNFTRLQELGLASNGIQGQIPSGVFTHMGALQTLDLSDNYLLGAIPADLDFAIKSTVQTLLLGGNKLSSSVPSSIASSQSLQTVNISHNFFTGTLPDVWDTPSLQMLDCSSNNLSGSIPVSLFALSSIQHLNLANNGFSGSVPGNLTCRFGSSSFAGNPGLLVEPCTSSNSISFVHTIPPLSGPATPASSPLLSPPAAALLSPPAAAQAAGGGTTDHHLSRGSIVGLAIAAVIVALTLLNVVGVIIYKCISGRRTRDLKVTAPVQHRRPTRKFKSLRDKYTGTAVEGQT